MTAALTTYLNDHNAGAHAALILLERLAETHTERREWLSRLRHEISADREVLRDIMRRLEIAESTTKQMTGWIGEKLAALKLALESPDADFHRLEALEGLSLGITGKYKLWLALADVAAGYASLATIDFEGLKGRALEQHDDVERERIVAARAALARA